MALIDNPHYTIRTLLDGEADDRMIEAEYSNLAGRLYIDTVDMLRRMDLDYETSVQMINPDGTVEYETTIPAI